MRSVPAILAVALLAGCTVPGLEPESLAPGERWPDSPDACIGARSARPLTYDDVASVRLDLGFTTKPERIHPRNLSADEEGHVLQLMVDSVPALPGRNVTGVDATKRPIMDGGSPFHHTGDWTYAVRIDYPDGPSDLHAFYVDKPDNRSVTRTEQPSGSLYNATDDPDLFEIGYARADLFVPNETAEAARQAVESWNGTDPLPEDWVFREATWTPSGTSCTRVVYDHPSDIWMPWCRSTRSFWAHATLGFLAEEPPVDNTTTDCPAR